MENNIQVAVDYALENKENFVKNLSELIKIPSVSANGFDKENINKAAEKVRELMIDAGLKNTEVIGFPLAHPYVYGEWVEYPDKPTILLYAHYDVQPPGRPEKWVTPAFQASERDGRLYGRGSSDDKAGVMLHLASIKSYLETNGNLPLNIKVLIEGEEEIGSESLEIFVNKYRDKLKSDLIVLADTSNLDVGLPSITYLLRGVIDAIVEVKSLKAPVHSGSWGGPLPDPAMGLCKLLSTLTNSDGKIAIEGVYDDIKILSEKEKENLKSLPFNEENFKKQSGLLEDASLQKFEGASVYEQLWYLPSLTIVAMESCALKDAANQIMDSAKAKVGIRIVPNQDPKKVLDLLVEHLRKNAPEGYLVEVTPDENTGIWWETNIDKKVFDFACRALKKGYNKQPVFVGTGGSIPFIKPFSEALGGVPCILIGVEDPYCKAHSENESLLLDDFYKGIISNIYLYDELSNALTKE